MLPAPPGKTQVWGLASRQVSAGNRGLLTSLGVRHRRAQLHSPFAQFPTEVEITSARPLDSIGGYRAMFDLVPDDSLEPIDLRLQLKLGNQVLTETWLYQYTPPPKDERTLY